MKSFKELYAWQSCHKIVMSIYSILYPGKEKYGLESQIRRSAVSVTSNIAEGFGRYTAFVVGVSISSLLLVI